MKNAYIPAANAAITAAYLRFGLEAEIVAEEDAKNWALAIVDSLASPPLEIIEVLASRNLQQTIENLKEVPGAYDLQLVGHMLLCTLGYKLQQKNAAPNHIAKQAMQVARSTELGDEAYYAFDAIDDGLNLAATGAYGTLDECCHELETELAKYIAKDQ